MKVLFVRNLANGVTEEILEKSFSQFGKLERVKKLKDYAFIHFEERDGAVKVLQFFHIIDKTLKFKFLSLDPIHPCDCWTKKTFAEMLTNVSDSSQALEEMNGKELEGEPIEIVFAKPPDQKRKERKAQRQAAKTQM